MKINAKQLAESISRLPTWSQYPRREYYVPTFDFQPEIIIHREICPKPMVRQDIKFTRNHHTGEWELDFDQFK